MAIPKTATGQMYLKEGSSITVTDTMPANFVFDGMDAGPAPTVSGDQLTWTFAAPTIAAQEVAADTLFATTLRLWIEVPNDTNLEGTEQTNTAQASMVLVNDDIVNSSPANRKINIRSFAEATGTITGQVWTPAHYGPIDGNGSYPSGSNYNPNPTVTDQALLLFEHIIVPRRFPVNKTKFFDYVDLNIEYWIDSRLILKELRTPGEWMFVPDASYDYGIPLNQEPEYDIYLTVNGTENPVPAVSNPEPDAIYTRQMLGLSDTDQVTKIRYAFTRAPAGMYSYWPADYYFYVEPGTAGVVSNKIVWHGTDKDDELSAPVPFYIDFDATGDPNDAGNGAREATIVPPATPLDPVGTIAIDLQTHKNGEVVYGDNRAVVTLSNLTSAAANINKMLQAAVLLPAGVSLASTPNPQFIDADRRVAGKEAAAAGGQLNLLDADYNGTGRQLVLVQWNDWRIMPGKKVEASFDIVISKNTPSNVLNFEVYGYASNSNLSGAVPP